MAKTRSTGVSISGKIDGKVYSDGRYGSTVKKASDKKASGRRLESLEKNFKHNSHVNSLAGDINLFIKKQAQYLHTCTLYERLLSVFKSLKISNRYILLKYATKIEINVRRPIERLSTYTLTTEAGKEAVKIKLEVTDHPKVYRYESYECNCHYYQFYLMTWSGEERGTWQTKRTSWISNKKNIAKYTLSLSYPENTDHWLLLIRNVGGQNNIMLETVKAEAIAFVDAGTLVNGEEEAYLKFKEEQTAREKIIGSSRRKEDVEIVEEDE